MDQAINGKPFTDTLREIEGGALVDDLTLELRRIVNAALETRKAGALNLSLSVSVSGRGTIEIDAKYTAKIPEHGRPTTTFFTTPEGTLLRNDPNQPQLPLRSVDDPRGAVRHVND